MSLAEWLLQHRRVCVHRVGTRSAVASYERERNAALTQGLSDRIGGDAPQVEVEECRNDPLCASEIASSSLAAVATTSQPSPRSAWRSLPRPRRGARASMVSACSVIRRSAQRCVDLTHDAGDREFQPHQSAELMRHATCYQPRSKALRRRRLDRWFSCSSQRSRSRPLSAIDQVISTRPSGTDSAPYLAAFAHSSCSAIENEQRHAWRKEQVGPGDHKPMLFGLRRGRR